MKEQQRQKRHVEKDYSSLIGQIKGMSERQLKAHFKLYSGYVKKLNEIEEKLASTDPGTANYSYGEISELLRRRPVAFNGVYLHELFFENISGKESQPSAELKNALDTSFGSMERWWDCVSAGLVSAPGWILVTRSPWDGGLRNELVEEHHRGLLAESDIILALDGWEHAYMVDYAAEKEQYIEMLERSINWNVVTQRFERAGMIARVAA